MGRIIIINILRKRANETREASDAFLLRALQTGFGFAVVFNTLKEAYPCPSPVLRRHRLATFVEAGEYIKIGTAIFIRHSP